MTHIRRIRQSYAEQRDLLATALRPLLGPSISLSSQPSGLHLVLRLPENADDVAIAARAVARGILVRALSTYYIAAPRARGLVVGYGYAPASQVVAQGRRLADVVRLALRQD
jgi:GntR family transcriptional regulator/MocR family aminotransferase